MARRSIQVQWPGGQPNIFCKKLPVDVRFDLIIGATYTPLDTIVTLAQYVPHHLGVPHIPVLSVSTACSSTLNTFEIAQGFFAMGRAANALIVASDQHSAYYDETDKLGGLLWGDGSMAFAVSKERLEDSDMNELYLHAAGMGTIQHATPDINLRPATSELKMNGAGIFFNRHASIRSTLNCKSLM